MYIYIYIFTDVVLMDLFMPEMSRFEAAKLIRERLPGDDQPTIVALTSSDDIVDRMHVRTCILSTISSLFVFILFIANCLLFVV